MSFLLASLQLWEHRFYWHIRHNLKVDSQDFRWDKHFEVARGSLRLLGNPNHSNKRSHNLQLLNRMYSCWNLKKLDK